MNATTFQLGTIFGYKMTAGLPALLGSAGLWFLLALVGVSILHIPWPGAILGGVVCILLHWFGEIWHQAGHSAAARRTGHPMESVHFVWVLGFSHYPKDEPKLPARIHILRAFGGPVFSLFMTVFAALVFYALPDFWNSKTVYWTSLFFFLDNLLVFTLGALLPLGFTDGSTILRYWNHR